MKHMNFFIPLGGKEIIFILAPKGVIPSVEQTRAFVVGPDEGVLLNIGKQSNFNVISILAEAHPNYPDARAAAAAINVMALLMNMEIM